MKAIQKVCRLIFTVLTLGLAFFSTTQASVIIDGTRIIYPSDSKEVTVKLTNNGQYPVLIQSWIDTGNPDELPEKIAPPFVLTPPVARVNAGEGQTLRINNINTLPILEDRESVYWLNVLEIPPRPQQSTGKNYLQVALRTRIKIFYRPASLRGNASEAVNTLKWQANAGHVRVTNPTPFHVSLDKIEANNKIISADMIAPLSQSEIDANISSGSNITVNWIDDFGATKKYTTRVN